MDLEKRKRRLKNTLSLYNFFINKQQRKTNKMTKRDPKTGRFIAAKAVAPKGKKATKKVVESKKPAKKTAKRSVAKKTMSKKTK